jgi:hypothetical protein
MATNDTHLDPAWRSQLSETLAPTDHDALRPWVARTSGAGPFQNLVDSLQLESLLAPVRAHIRECGRRSTAPNIRLVQQHVSHPDLPQMAPTFFDEQIPWHGDAERVISQLDDPENRYTCFIRHTERLVDTLPPFLKMLAPVHHEDVRISTFITPFGADGFRMHTDMDSFLALQVAGTKTWTIANAQSCIPIAETFIDSDGITEGGAIGVFTIELQPGDLLYIPGGWAHSATTSSTHTPSIHFSFTESVESSYSCRLRDLHQLREQFIAPENTPWLASPEELSTIANHNPDAVMAIEKALTAGHDLINESPSEFTDVIRNIYDTSLPVSSLGLTMLKKTDAITKPLP